MNYRQSLLLSCVALMLASCCAITRAAEPIETRLELLKSSPRIVFLGDSITAGGGYVAGFEAWLLSQRWAKSPIIINAGLPSETASGLSEEGHAGGAFPRPDVAERLARVLKETKPDLVFACYGMNCGIYQPFSDERFARYQQGIEQLKAAVEKAGATIILVTPPFYDDHGQKKQDYYDGVLARYSDWLVSQRKSGWQVIDLHSAMASEVTKRRQQDPKFTFAGDGVHPNDAGHWFIAQHLIAWFGDEKAAAEASPAAMLKASGFPLEAWPLVQQRMSVRRDAYVSAAGHKRPGVAKGLPIEAAEAKAAEITTKLDALAKP
ncbi:MAG TPA: SGNH/GDSL hydrolase family protein [Pirellulaceae bacterium]|nr:SGNH/GDSL hydrolase family protein [Pirellulaceae bacterium]